MGEQSAGHQSRWETWKPVGSQTGDGRRKQVVTTGVKSLLMSALAASPVAMVTGGSAQVKDVAA